MTTEQKYPKKSNVKIPVVHNTVKCHLPQHSEPKRTHLFISDRFGDMNSEKYMSV